MNNKEDSMVEDSLLNPVNLSTSHQNPFETSSSDNLNPFENQNPLYKPKKMQEISTHEFDTNPPSEATPSQKPPPLLHHTKEPKLQSLLTTQAGSSDDQPLWSEPEVSQISSTVDNHDLLKQNYTHKVRCFHVTEGLVLIFFAASNALASFFSSLNTDSTKAGILRSGILLVALLFLSSVAFDGARTEFIKKNVGLMRKQIVRALWLNVVLFLADAAVIGFYWDDFVHMVLQIISQPVDGVIVLGLVADLALLVGCTLLGFQALGAVNWLKNSVLA